MMIASKRFGRIKEVGVNMACFSFDNYGITQTIQNLGAIAQEIETAISKQQAKISELQEALSAAQAAYNAALAAYSKDCASKAQSAASRGETPVFDTPPSDSGVQSAQAALIAAQQVLRDLQNDAAVLKNVISTLNDTSNTIRSTEESALAYITSALVDIQLFSNQYGEKIINTITNNAKNVYEGYDYIQGKNGEKLYVDLYNDLTMPEYVTLGKNIGADTLIAIMAAQNKPVEQILAALQTMGTQITKADLEKKISKAQKLVYNDSTSNATEEEVLSSGENTTIIDGVLQQSVVGATSYTGTSGASCTLTDILNLNGKVLKVQNDGNAAHDVQINIDKTTASQMLAVCNEFNIDPRRMMAVMAHESQFVSTASSGYADGLLQVNPNYFNANVATHTNFVAEIGGNASNIYDSAANMTAWANSYNAWRDIYGDYDCLKALRQGYKGSGWSTNANANAAEFIDIETQIEAYMM